MPLCPATFCLPTIPHVLPWNDISISIYHYYSLCIVTCLFLEVIDLILRRNVDLKQIQHAHQKRHERGQRSRQHLQGKWHL